MVVFATSFAGSHMSNLRRKILLEVLGTLNEPVEFAAHGSIYVHIVQTVKVWGVGRWPPFAHSMTLTSNQHQEIMHFTLPSNPPLLTQNQLIATCLASPTNLNPIFLMSRHPVRACLCPVLCRALSSVTACPPSANFLWFMTTSLLCSLPFNPNLPTTTCFSCHKSSLDLTILCTLENWSSLLTMMSSHIAAKFRYFI